MTAKKTSKATATAKKAAPKARKAAAASAKPVAKSKIAAAKTAKTAEKSAAPAKKRAPAAKKSPAKTKTPAAKSKKRTAKAEPEAAHPIGEAAIDPVGDETSGEGQTYLGEVDAALELDEFRKDTNDAASDAIVAGPGAEAAEARARSKAVDADEDGEVDRVEAAPRPAAKAEPAKPEPAKPEPAKLERLQKILSQAGVASRRSAEEMIAAGRVIVNGQVVTQLGTKADAARDHIRVDGKLLRGAERHRYFMLNKPRGYVTTMSDPEGRPTVMEFFAGARERVYPVGRLDYLSEGLLLMTNDGELANLLTKAGSGVEKTYLVKVAGQPSAEELERLRGGVTIDKGEPGSSRVRTAPARIQQVREGDNPWFEVVLIEGRNRELRKMFGAIGHFAEKIRRVGYGPLVLDLEPGKVRELDEEEVNALRLTAEGKMKPKRAKAEKLLPKEAGLAAEKRGKPRGGKFDRKPNRNFDRGAAPRFDRRPERPVGGGVRNAERGPQSLDSRLDSRGKKPRWNREDRGPQRASQPRGEGFRAGPAARPEFRPAPRQDRGERPFSSAPRGPFKPRGEGFRGESKGRPEFRSAPRQDRGSKPFGSASRPPFKPRSDRPEFSGGSRQTGGGKPFGSAPRGSFKPRSDRPEFRPGPGPDRGEKPFGGASRPPFKPRSDRPENRGSKPFGGAPRGSFKPRSDRPQWKREDAARPRLEVERIAGPEEGAGFSGVKAKPSFGRKPGFGAKPGFGSKPGGFGKFRGNTRGGPKRSSSRPGAPRGGGKRG
jgi:23S rRNA pseudouridine2605 synthase